jgi:hypothetical protein
LSDSKNEALRNYPELAEILNQLAAELAAAKRAEPADRRYYIPVLAKIYEMVQSWDPTAGADRVAAVNALQAKTYRKNSTPFGIVVGAVGERAGTNSKTANRWANELTEAWNAAVASDDISKFLCGKR